MLPYWKMLVPRVPPASCTTVAACAGIPATVAMASATAVIIRFMIRNPLLTFVNGAASNSVMLQSRDSVKAGQVIDLQPSRHLLSLGAS